MSEKFLLDDNGIQRFLVTINVNGIDYTRMVKANTVLVNFIRDELDLTGTKRGCELGDCGSCTVLVDGKPMNSCLILAVEADGRKITTIEGVSASEHWTFLQEKFLEYGAIQCGYCSAGMILSAKALLTKNPRPPTRKCRRHLRQHLPLHGYVNIIRAILAASGQEVENHEKGGEPWTRENKSEKYTRQAYNVIGKSKPRIDGAKKRPARASTAAISRCQHALRKILHSPYATPGS